MKLSRFLVIPLILAFSMSQAPGARAEADPGQISISVGRLLEQGHYTRRKLDPEMSKLFLKDYLEGLDYNHLFFTQGDIDSFQAKYSSALADDILLGNPNAAFEIWDVYTKRVEDRVAKIKELLKKDYDFKSDRTIELDRRKAPWPKDEAEADALWRDRIEGELLQEKLIEHPVEPALKAVTRRYNQVLRNIHETTREDVIKTFLTELAQTYDPHSEYMSKADLESFNIQMRLSLVGIGAVLSSEEGYAKILDLVQGGPAQMSGHLKVGDRISAVAQGDGEFVDVIDMKLDKVVELIRGKKGTTVRLKVVPAHSSEPKVVEIVRDEVKLKEQEAKAELIEQDDGNGQPRRLGWIRLPSFYADMEHSGSKNAKSTTKDVLALLNRLKAENISGLVIDLRNNGGGSLEEAINLTGLFVKQGPVVQTKDSNGNLRPSRISKSSKQVYDGPLVILCNRLSASASEIFAAALQDYGRAVIVGDTTTFGKGTVQTMLEIGQFIPILGGDSHDAGALKLTIQKFYRIAGGSTQLHGVTSDIRLPSTYDYDVFGEQSLKNPLPYDVVEAAQYDKVTDHPLFLPELRQRSEARVAANPEFAYVTEDLDYIKKKILENRTSLNEKERRQEMADAKAKTTKRTAEREKHKKPDEKVYAITLDNVDKPDLQPVKNDAKKAASDDPDAAAEDADDDSVSAKKTPVVDPQKTEALNIVDDLIDLSHAPKTASTVK
ncbi:MAG: carboxy terminal-processing peptidase [Chthoniobacteraceae bacterium]